MASKPDTYKEDFERAEKLFKKYGYTVINPAILPDGLNHEKYMPICLTMLDAADFIYMLAGWEDSKGARLEKAYAEYQGKDIVYEITEGE